MAASLSPEQSPLYQAAESLHPLHWEALRRRSADEAAAASGATAEGEDLLLRLLGCVLRVRPGPRLIAFESDPARPVGYQRALVAVAYLAGAQDVPVKGQWVAFRELPGGQGFFRGPHSLPTPKIEKAYGETLGGLLAAVERVGGGLAEGSALELPALPKVPLRLHVWPGTEEFPAAATLLTDFRAYLHLPLDVLWALANVAVADLVRGTP